MTPVKMIVTISFTLFFLTSCSLMKAKEQAKQLENIAYISGSVDNQNHEHSVYVVLLKQLETHVEIQQQTLVDDNNNYQFNVLPGNYIIGAYLDENENKLREATEKSTLYKQETNLYKVINVAAGEHIVLNNIAITAVLDTSKLVKATINLSKVHTNIGKVISLNDAIFSAENSSLGLWQPLTFVNELGGGLFMLQPYETGKTPVIFVHGILGNPTEFETMISALDREKYQPWILYYASGIQLELISKYLLNGLNQLQEKHNFEDIYLIAHSMGGLMSRSFLMKHQQQEADFNIPFYMTINSPLYGMTSAKSGVENSPIVIPSWRDLATNSDYIKKVHQWHVPADTAYHLVFSYLPEEAGDGVVPMSSQLSLSLQDEATQIYGFNAQHAKILKKTEFITRFTNILAKHDQSTHSDK